LIHRIGFENALKIGIMITTGFIFLALYFSFYDISHPYWILIANSLFYLGMSFTVTTAATRAFGLLTNDKGIGIAFVSMIRNIVLTISVISVSIFYDRSTFPLFIGTSLIGAFIIFLYNYQKKIKHISQ
jgi:hypothetical protein